MYPKTNPDSKCRQLRSAPGPNRAEYQLRKFLLQESEQNVGKKLWLSQWLWVRFRSGRTKVVKMLTES